MTRRQFVLALGAVPSTLVAGASYTRYLEPDWLDVTEKHVGSGIFTRPLRAAHLTDFHVVEESDLERVEKAIELVLAGGAEVAFLTGDFVTGRIRHAEAYVACLRRLASAMPTFASLGNHDGGSWTARAGGYRNGAAVIELLRAAGVRVLVNEKVTVEVDKRSFVVAGLGDLWAGNFKPEAVLSAERDGDVPMVVLSHNPDTKEILRRYDWDLLLSGHTHGGQLVVPILGYRPFLPVRDKSFPEGLLRWENRYIHLSRGVGNLHGVRFNCRPEVSLLDIS